MLKLNMTEDQIQESIQAIAGKGKQSITWDQFNAFLAKKTEKKNWLSHNIFASCCLQFITTTNLIALLTMILVGAIWLL